MATKRDEQRYKPRHVWYLAEAQLLVRDLQAACWPLFHHVTLGGGVLNHGYSDKDVDIYVLPNYRPNVVHADIETDLVNAISSVIGTPPLTDMKANSDETSGAENFVPVGHNHDWVEGGCFAHSLRYEDTKGRTIDVFIVRALPKHEAPAAGQGADKLPTNDKDELVRRLEEDYDFECTGGLLKNCAEWRRLKGLL